MGGQGSENVFVFLTTYLNMRRLSKLLFQHEKQGKKNLLFSHRRFYRVYYFFGMLFKMDIKYTMNMPILLSPVTFRILSLHSLPICVKWKWNCLKIHGIKLIPYLIEFSFSFFFFCLLTLVGVCILFRFFFGWKNNVIQPEFNRLKLRIVVLRGVIRNFTFFG